MMGDVAAGQAGTDEPLFHGDSSPPRSPAASLIITIPLPFKGLYPNDRMNRWDKASQYRDFKQQCFVDARNAMSVGRRLHGWSLRAPVRAQAIFNFHKQRGRDGDNLAAALKGCWDGFVRAGLLPGDTIRELFIDPVQATVDKTKPEGVTITLTEVVR